MYSEFPAARKMIDIYLTKPYSLTELRWLVGRLREDPQISRRLREDAKENMML